jgi:hypothetical protein
MSLRYDAAAFVCGSDSTIPKLHLFQFLGMLETREARNLLSDLLETQMPSGGFPSRLDKEVEGVRETCRHSLLLLMCGLLSKGQVISKSVDYLLENQRKDGGWSENPSLRIPSHILELSTKDSITWLTADIIHLLRMAGLGETTQCGRALSWLRAMQNPNGGWPMFAGYESGFDPDSTAQILFMMRDIHGEESNMWRKGVPLFEKCLDQVARDVERGYYVAPNGEKRQNEIYHLTHLLLSSLVDTNRRMKAGYDLRDKRVKKIVRGMIETQREDGGWKPFFAKESSPTSTTLALKLLFWLGVLSREELRRRVYAFV